MFLKFLRKLKSLQWRLVFIFALISFTLMIIVGVLLNISLESSYYSIFKGQIENGFKNWPLLTDSNDKILSSDDAWNALTERRDAMIFFSMTSEFRTYSIIDKNNKVHKGYSSDSNFRPDENGVDMRFQSEILKSKNLLSVLSGKKLIGDAGTLVYGESSVFYDYARKLKLSDGEYVLYFKYDRGEWQESIDKFNNIILRSLIVAIFVSLILGYILSRTITVPIGRLMNKVQMIAEGNFDYSLEVNSDDEIGKLTEASNLMALRLKETLAKISGEKNKIETILNYMTDGVVAFDERGEVIHASPATKRILAVEKLPQNFSEFSSKFNINLNFNEILNFKDKSNKNVNIKIEETTVKVYFALFFDEENKADGMIAVFQDITEQQKLENMRREFVANVSHELKTPLTSIKSYSETLLTGALNERDTLIKFLNVIDSEADRMGRLVRELLQLSSIDNDQLKWNIHEISITNLIKNTVDKIRKLAENKKQVILFQQDDDIPRIKVDRDRIEQVIVNILSNAIKYTKEEGSINIYISSDEKNIKIVVSDTGIGIPSEELERVFERFYRVDKARSREMGGTGLGLSIAKELVEAHSGSISISSEVGVGTSISILLPFVTNN